MGNLGFGYKPTHPGELLKEEIEYRGISQRKIASQMGISYTVLNDILNERRPLTTNTAMMFEAALGVPAYILIGMQTDYNLQVASQDKKFLARLAEISKVAAII
jgi:addiction module HigA family antidote